MVFSRQYAGDMKVFVSWSGPRSKQLAESLSRWIPNVIQDTDCFYSSESIRAGQQWNERINNRLSDTDFGILCVTAENRGAPWLNFEAGALSTRISNDQRVVPVTLGFSPEALGSPLGQFNGVEANYQGVLKLIMSIQDAAASTVDVPTTVDLWWPHLEADINRIPASDAVEQPALPDVTELLTEILSVVRGLAREQVFEYKAALPLSLAAQAVAALERVKGTIPIAPQPPTEAAIEFLEQYGIGVRTIQDGPLNANLRAREEADEHAPEGNAPLRFPGRPT